MTNLDSTQRMHELGMLGAADAEEELPNFPPVRSDRELLVSMCQLLEENLMVNQKILAALGTSSDSRSSVEIKTSTRGVDITAKSYDHSDVEAQVGPAVSAYFAAMESVQARINA